MSRVVRSVLIRRSECSTLAEPLPLQTVDTGGQEGADHEIRFGLAGSRHTWGIIPASSQECEPEISLASLDGAYMVGSVQHRVESDRSTASVKEGEFETSETIAAIERNREDRERTVVIDR